MNRNQILALIIAVLGVWVGAATQFDTLFGPTVSKLIVAASGLTMSSLAAALGVLTGQIGMVKDVQAMPGIDKLVVNRNATQGLAAAAVDPANQKIEPAPGAENALAQKAAGA